MKNIKIHLRVILVLIAALLFPSFTHDLIAAQPLALLEYVVFPGELDFGDDIDVHSINVKDQDYTVCLNIDPHQISDGNGLGAELLNERVRQGLTPVEWRSLSVLVYDDNLGQCRPLTEFLPAFQAASYTPEYSVQPGEYKINTALSGSGSLAGKTVYVSAGHGWKWTAYGWRTQRVVYEDFIEDHNNAEAVDQYLIPYLENAGAKVIPMRERDWNATRVIRDNDDGAPAYEETGTWTTSHLSGYLNKTYRYATSVNGAATAVATWHLAVDQTSEYAVYAWIKPGGNRVPDAHYVIYHAGGQTEVYLDQRIGPSTWRYLGTFPFYAGPIMVTLDNISASATATAVIADAIRVGGGNFDSFDGIFETSTESPYPGSPPNEPYWETSAYYFSQWMGMNPAIWSYFNDVIARPLYARWNHAGTGEDAVYISWHTNGWRGITQGTESYVHNNVDCARTAGSLELQSALHNELVHDIRAGWDADWIDRGKKQADLGEVRMLCDGNPAESDIPGVLFEIAFHDHPDDANALKDPRFNQLSARALYQGLVQYFENRDGVNLTLLPESPTHLRVVNNGSGQLLVSWEPGPTDSSGLLGDAASGYKVYTSPDGFAWGSPFEVTSPPYTLSNLALGEVIYVKVTGLNAGGESFPTEVLGARVGEAQLLIVNGFDMLTRHGTVVENDPIMGTNRRIWLDQMNARNYVVHHGDAVGDFSGWDSTSNEAVYNSKISLLNYGVVDWLLGEESLLGDGALNAAERTALNVYLAQGRGLLLSGSDIGWDLEELGVDPNFLHSTLRTDYLADDAHTYTIQPAPGSIFTGLPNFSYNTPGEYIADFADVIAPLSGAATCLSYSGGSGGTAAIQYEDVSRRLVVMGFPFEVIQPNMRPGIMSAVLEFLGTRVTDTVITHPLDNDYYSTVPAFTGTAVGEALTQVDVQVLDMSKSLYWNGIGWGGETWVPAAGTYNWTYALSNMTEGTYSLSARAVGEMIDDTPDEITIHLDWTAPNMVTALFPADKLLQISPVVVFQWDAPLGDASPLRYHLEIDGEVSVVHEISYVTAIGNGTHAWRVAAVDAAGNQGPWNSSREFTVDSKTFYLPFVIQE